MAGYNYNPYSANNSQSLQIIATDTSAGTLTHANVVIIHL